MRSPAIRAVAAKKPSLRAGRGEQASVSLVCLALAMALLALAARIASIW